MPLQDVSLSLDRGRLPADVRELLDEADSRVDRFVRRGALPGRGFVPSDFVTVYHALQKIKESSLAPGDVFCEWGSGFGVVASTATMLELDACGIEIERELVEAARSLAADFDLPVEFVQGSFIPRGGEAVAEEGSTDSTEDYFWLACESDGAYEELGRSPEDFDLIFAYPWPGEEYVIGSLFERYAADQALLLTYDQFDTVRLQRRAS